MDVSGRPSKISSVVAALCIFIYIVAIAFGVVQVIESIGERRSFAEKEFYDLADIASSSAVFLGFMSDPYQETIRDFIKTSDTLLGVIITGSDGEYAFEREAGSGIVWAGNSPRFKTGFGFPGEPFLLYLRIEGQRNVTIQAIYSPVESNFTLMVLRNTLLAVLGALAIALITLLVEITAKNRASHYRTGEDRGSQKDDGYYVSAAETKDTFESSEKTGNYPAEEDNSEEPSTEQDPFLDAGECSDSGEDASTNEQEPLGLYTPRGNIGWESYTHDRLNSELHRCAAFEQDLVFMVMEFSGSEKINDTLYRQFADEAVTFFAMRDLIFEREEYGISVIIPSTDLEQGISKSEEFHNRIIASLAESIKSREEGQRTELCTGLSSRNGRLIEADRLMLEASKALEKALEDPASPIMAFKSDPEKYRDFLKGRN